MEPIFCSFYHDPNCLATKLDIDSCPEDCIIAELEKKSVEEFQKVAILETIVDDMEDDISKLQKEIEELKIMIMKK